MAQDRKQSEDQMRDEAKIVSMSTEPAPEGGIPAEARGLIGHQLREEYRRLLAEPLPDKFTKLLDELAQSEAQPASKVENNE